MSRDDNRGKGKSKDGDKTKEWFRARDEQHCEEANGEDFVLPTLNTGGITCDKVGEI